MKNREPYIDPKYLHSELTGSILKCFYALCNDLGFGFSNEVYKNALLTELKQSGLKAEKDFEFTINYKGSDVGSCVLDVLVEGKVGVMIVSRTLILPEDEATFHNRFKIGKIEVGLILNVWIEGEHKRKFAGVFS